MNKTLIVAALAAGVMFGYSGRMWAQADQQLPMAGVARRRLCRRQGTAES